MVEKKRLFDIDGFYRALDDTRRTRRMNWKELATESGVNPSTLARMPEKSPDADGLAALAAWSGLNPADYVPSVQKTEQPEALSTIGQALRGDPNLSHLDSHARESLEKLITTAYTSFAKPKLSPDKN